jgi:hypothetical protein
VTIEEGHVIHVRPAKDWSGETRVTVRVSDGLLTEGLSFRVIVRSVNDCPVISPRVPDPEAVPFGQPVVLDLAPHAKDAEDQPSQLAWRARIDPQFEDQVSVLGQGTSQLTFLPNRRTRENFGVRATLTMRDRDGCEASQTIALYWAVEPNTRPIIDYDRFVREYIAPVNTTIQVDLTGVANDGEDGAETLEWFVVNPAELPAQVHRRSGRQLDFEPEVGFLGSAVAELEVQDSGAARATAAITLTWRPAGAELNIPPRILRHELVGKTVGWNSEACYDLTDKAVDPDDSPLSLRWYAMDYDETSLFVGAQGTRELCVTSRSSFVGCLNATFLVRDPKGGEDSHEVRTCWQKINTYLPFAATR